MNKRLWIALPFLAVTLGSCGSYSHALSDYARSLDLFKGNTSAKILQLTDIHWSMWTDLEKQSAYLTALVKKASPDFIMITGDSFSSANQTTVTTLWSLVDRWKIPWAFVFGNHDESGTYDPGYPSRIALSHSFDHQGYCAYQEVDDDDVYGDSNYVLNLTDGSKTLWQIYGIDSNSLKFNGVYYDYDVIHPDEIKWYENEVNAATKANGGAVVPSLAFFHIPLWQTEYAYRLSENQTSVGTLLSSGGVMTESVYAQAPLTLKGTRTYPGYQDSGFFAKAEELGSTKGIFYGHDHINDFYAVYHDDGWTGDASKGILLAYGIKSGDGLYYDPAMIGGALITIHSDGSFDPKSDYSQLFYTYEEAGL
jgi:hypothetical protein